MAITYPLSLPSHTGIRGVELRATNAVTVERSPFTFSSQVQASAGQMWQADVTLPPMKRADAEQWIAWLVSLRGQLGTFTMGDPLCKTPRGTALGGRVNLLDYSEQFDNASWTKGNSTITANSIASPDGFTTADTLVENTATSTHTVQQGSVPVVSGNTYTFSIYIKAQSARNIRLVFQTTSFGGVASSALFNPVDGSVVATAGGVTTTTQSVGDGWFRVSISKTATVTQASAFIYRLSDGSADTYLGDGVSGAYIWGAQLEVGPVPTTYQPIFSGYGPFVNGADQTGDSLIIDGASPDESGYLLPGDYIQLGSGATATLHKVLTQVDTDSSGNATVDIWPSIRTAPADNATVVVSNTVGLWRLATNESSWSINEASIYGISFSAMEAIG
jgi:hypothetical protein